MSNLEASRAWSDERHKARLEMREAITRIEASASATTLTQEDVLELVVEVAAAHYAWSCDPAQVAYQIGRLARRIRMGDKLEL